MHCKYLIFIAFLPFLLSIGCQKSTDIVPDSDNDSLHTAICNQFSYSDSVYFISDQVTNHSVSPVVAQNGTYGAYPGGLAINQSSGTININGSETGLKYLVWFIPAGFTDTCKTFVTISGVHYTDSIYVLNNNDSLARPYYNAVRGGAPPCQSSDDDDDDDDDDSCQFDDDGDGDDDDDDDPPTGGQLRAQGIDVNTRTGIINLEQTVRNGAFGTTPVSGSFKDVTMYYRLNDASLHSLNKIDLRIYYFDSRSEVPASLLEEMDINQSGIYRKKASSRVNGLIKKPRPPIIIIVRSI